MTVVGVLGGALAGAETQKAVTATTVYQVAVNMETGGQRVITLASALSCSMRAFCLSEFLFAFWYAGSAATWAGIPSVINLWTRSASVHWIFLN